MSNFHKFTGGILKKGSQGLCISLSQDPWSSDSGQGRHRLALAAQSPFSLFPERAPQFLPGKKPALTLHMYGSRGVADLSQAAEVGKWFGSAQRASDHPGSGWIRDGQAPKLITVKCMSDPQVR